jgi:hypothetical protein
MHLTDHGPHEAGTGVDALTAVHRIKPHSCHTELGSEKDAGMNAEAASS